MLICGPSGSGQTTLLTALAQYCQCKVIALTVCRKHRRRVPEAGKIEVAPEYFGRLQSALRFQYRYEENLYGFSIPSTAIWSAEFAFVDYPREYPACSELDGIPWRGILVLPPSRCVLERRLIQQQRESGISGAIGEYSECFHELEKGEYREPQWRVYISQNEETLTRFVTEVDTGQLFQSTTGVA